MQWCSVDVGELTNLDAFKESEGSVMEDFSIMWLITAVFESARPQEVQQEQVDLRELKPEPEDPY